MNAATFEAIRNLINEQRIAIRPSGRTVHLVAGLPGNEEFRSFCERHLFWRSEVAPYKADAVDHWRLCRECLRHFLAHAYLVYMESPATPEKELGT